MYWYIYIVFSYTYRRVFGFLTLESSIFPPFEASL
nr:MAG TPA: hypothetical protein [Caudoviricetes sp.]